MPAPKKKKVKKSTRARAKPLRAAFGRKKVHPLPKKQSAPAPISRPSVHWRIRVLRYDPSRDFSPTTHEYSIAPKDGESILDLLTRLKHTQDGSLTFRGSCGYGGCGACGVRVNGKPVLGCVTQVKDHVDAHHSLRIDPLDSENTVKDLVSDEKNFFDQLPRVQPWIVPRIHDAKRNHKMGVNDVAALGKSQQCILCGLCNANAQSSTKPELGPAAFVKGYRYANDIRDGDATRTKNLARNLPIHYSLEKANLCPRDIRPGDKIREVQAKADKSGNPTPAQSTRKGKR